MRTSFKKNQTIIIIIGVALIGFAIGFLSGNSSGTLSFSLTGAAGAAAREYCDVSPLSSSDPTGLVLADPLNFRVGPGLDYGIISILDYCTPLSLAGRTNDSSWLLVKTLGGIEGWVYAYYILPNTDIASLEVKTGFGGPDTPPAGTGTRDISVVIQYGQAATFLVGMPANTQLTATLAPSKGSAKGLIVSSGWTDANGAATLIFDMPTNWADGTKITSGQMTLTVEGGGASITAYITYYTY